MPKPSRASLTKLEQRLSGLEASQAARMAALKDKLSSLRKQINDLEEAQRAEMEEAERAVEQARDRYEDALREWAD